MLILLFQSKKVAKYLLIQNKICTFAAIFIYNRKSYVTRVSIQTAAK